MIQFLNAGETAIFLKKDQDNYLKSLYFPDLFARMNLNHLSKKDMGIIDYCNFKKYQHLKTSYLQKLQVQYMNIAVNASRTFSPKHIIILSKAVHLIEQIIKEVASKDLSYLRRYLKKEDLTFIFISNLLQKLQEPWKIALFDPIYENGLPHTRSNVIFIPTSLFKEQFPIIVNTLVHERIHILQKQLLKQNYKHILESLILKFGYLPLNTLPDKSQMPLLRSNPDIDNKLYVNIKNSQLAVTLYNNMIPNSISDVSPLITDRQMEQLITNNQLYQEVSNISFFSIKIKMPFRNKLQDHPFEQIAYFYSNFFIDYLYL